MKPYAISRVIVQLAIVFSWIGGAGAALNWMSLLPVLGAAVTHAVLVGVDALITIAREVTAQTTRLDQSVTALKRIAETQAAAFDRRRIG